MSSLSQFFGSSQARILIPVSESGAITMPFAGVLMIRCAGSGGSGARSGFPSGANGGTTGIKRTSVTAGQVVNVTIPNGGAPATVAGPGNDGGTLTVTTTGVSISIPGGRGGVQGSGLRPAANAAPTGLDSYTLGGIGGSTTDSTIGGGGGAAALLNGVKPGDGGSGIAGYPGGGGGVGGNGGDATGSSGGGGGGSFGPAVGAIGGPSFSGVTASAGSEGAPGINAADLSVVLLDVTGGGSGGGNGTVGSGPGGGGGSSNLNSRTGLGGGGAGGARGGNVGGGGGGRNNTPGDGGAGFVMLELLAT